MTRYVTFKRIKTDLAWSPLYGWFSNIAMHCGIAESRGHDNLLRLSKGVEFLRLSTESRVQHIVRYLSGMLYPLVNFWRMFMDEPPSANYSLYFLGFWPNEKTPIYWASRLSIGVWHAYMYTYNYIHRVVPFHHALHSSTFHYITMYYTISLSHRSVSFQDIMYDYNELYM